MSQSTAVATYDTVTSQNSLHIRFANHDDAFVDDIFPPRQDAVEHRIRPMMFSGSHRRGKDGTRVIPKTNTGTRFIKIPWSTSRASRVISSDATASERDMAKSLKILDPSKTTILINWVGVAATQAVQVTEVSPPQAGYPWSSSQNDLRHNHIP
jgi:hypothetical protein